MIGDDAEADAGGAMAAGLQAILARTGKYRPGHENMLKQAPATVAGGLGAAADWLLACAPTLP
jgi:ribonucleotide monophosphatase NagD (HAD superfamily)